MGLVDSGERRNDGTGARSDYERLVIFSIQQFFCCFSVEKDASRNLIGLTHQVFEVILHILFERQEGTRYDVSAQSIARTRAGRAIAGLVDENSRGAGGRAR